MSGLTSFQSFCSEITMPLCPLMQNPVEPSCYSRNIDVNGLLIFEPATLTIHFIALIMTAIMIWHIKSKYTAVGRKEIILFFYLYATSVVIEFFLISGIIPIASNTYPWFVAAYTGINLATVWSLLLNGFVGFQWIEDGTALSLWSLRISSLLVAFIGFFIAIGTFNAFAGKISTTLSIGMSNSNPAALFVFYMVFPAAFICIYVVFQIILIFTNLQDRWPLGDIFFGFTFFVVGQLMQYVVSTYVCTPTKHYVDGMFFGDICTLLSVMMVYKYWDSITKEDLEFSVGSKSTMWETKEARNPLLSDDALRTN